MPAGKCHSGCIFWHILTPLWTGYPFNLLSSVDHFIYIVCGLICETGPIRHCSFFPMSSRLIGEY